VAAKAATRSNLRARMLVSLTGSQRSIVQSRSSIAAPVQVTRRLSLMNRSSRRYWKSSRPGIATAGSGNANRVALVRQAVADADGAGTSPAPFRWSSLMRMNTGSSWRKALVACVTLAPALAQWQLVHSIPVPQLPIPFGTFRQVYDPDRQAVLLLGPATFAYDGASLATVTSLPPPASTAAFLAYDDRRHRAVWFDDVTQQTWELAGGTGSTWQRVVTAHAPTNRDGAMVYHARAGVCVYYGGYTGSFTSSSVETWHYDGVDWTLQPATGLGRQHHTMYYDSVRGVAVVYAGARGYSFTPVFDVETYDGTSWQTVGATFINPIGRLAFDPMHGRALS